MTPRQERLVENQERFRRANQRLHERVAVIARDGQRIPFLCECSDDSCVEPIEATLEEYAAVRGDDARFFILPGHPTIEGEEVVQERDGYMVVEKPLA